MIEISVFETTEEGSTSIDMYRPERYEWINGVLHMRFSDNELVINPANAMIYKIEVRFY